MPTDQWDRFEEQVPGRMQDSLGFDSTLDVYPATETYQQGDGWDISYSDTPSTTVDAELTTPNPSGEADRGGTTQEADIQIRVPDDTGVSWREFGESERAATRVEDVETGVMYEVRTVDSEHNGLLVLQAMEV